MSEDMGKLNKDISDFLSKLNKSDVELCKALNEELGAVITSVTMHEGSNEKIESIEDIWEVELTISELRKISTPQSRYWIEEAILSLVGMSNRINDLESLFIQKFVTVEPHTKVVFISKDDKL